MLAKRSQGGSFRTKLLIHSATVVGFGVALTALALGLYVQSSARKALLENRIREADLVATSVASALLFQDAVFAAEVLRTLGTDPNVVLACVYDSVDEVFARYPDGGPPCPQRPPLGAHFLERQLGVVRHVSLNSSERIGSLYVQSDLRSHRQRQRRLVLITAGVAGAALALAMVLSLRLLRSLTGPMRALFIAAQRVGKAEDYGVRVRKYSDDELGRLSDVFNHMLEKIEARDAALRVSAERLRSLFEQAPIPIWEADYSEVKAYLGTQDPAVLRESRLLKNEAVWKEAASRIVVLRANDAARRLYEADDDDALFAMLRREPAAALRRSFLACLDGRERAESDGELKTLRGTRRYVRQRWVVVRGHEEEASRVIVSLVDMTAHRDAEAAVASINRGLEQLVEARTRALRHSYDELEALSYSMSHDLRAPLRTIQGFSVLLERDTEETLPRKSRRHLDRIRRAAVRMGDILDDLVGLLRVSRAPLERRPVDMTALAWRIVRQMREAEPERQVNLVIQEDMTTHAEPGFMSILLTNLLGNAWKYTSKKLSPTIEFGQERYGDELVWFVRDDGAGFDMAHAEKLFAPFGRLHHPDEFPGNGIGLATVERAVIRHGGMIWAEGEPGRGTTVWFTLDPEGGSQADVSAPAARVRSV